MMKTNVCATFSIVLFLTSLDYTHAVTRKASGTPTPFLEFNLHKKTVLGKTDDGWHFLAGDYNNDGIVDMYGINQNGASRKTELHVLNGADGYSTYLQQTATRLGKTGSTWDFALGDYNKDGKLDIWGIKKNAKTTEIHIINGANPQQFLLQTATGLGPTDADWDFHVNDWNTDGKLDLVAIKKKGPASTEVHVLDGASGFKNFNLHVATALGKTDENWAFALGDYNGDSVVDLYAFKKKAKTTEVHILNGSNQFKSFLRRTRTGLHPTDENWQFQVADYDRDGKDDILTINTSHGDDTTFHFLRAATKQHKWSDSSIWTGSGIPMSHDLALIPAGVKVVLDMDVAVQAVEVDGELHVADASDIHLETDFLLVSNGLFQVGTEAKPFTNKFTLSLTGDDPNFDHQTTHGVAGDNAFLAVDGAKGKMHLHGVSRSKKAWTQLGATLEQGKSSIKLKEAVDWVVGDRIVIASTDFEMSQTEEFAIKAISADKTSITLNKAAKHMHYGKLQTYKNDKKTWRLDERAEVGLLSRNIVIQGGLNSALSKYGGHVVVRNGAFAQVEGCEFTRMGQQGIVGKYPWHWHMLGETTNQYFKDNSVHHTFNRAVTIHGTSNTLVQDVVAYDHIGHGYFLEDGSELRNSFINNLGLVTRQMDAATATIPTDNTHVSTFWITNPDNTFVGNAAGGSDHAGFWYALPLTPTGLSADQMTIRPRYTPLREFRANTAHTNKFSNFAIDGSPHPVTQKMVGGHYHPRNADGSMSIPVVSDFTSYKCLDRAIWMRSDTFDFKNIRSADNGRATFFAYSQTMSNSLIVGRSDNRGDSNPKQHRGHSIYDGPCGLDGVHFAGFKGKDQAIQTNGAAQKSTVHWVKNLSFAADSPVANWVDFSPATFVDYMWSSGLHDLDGSLTGTPGSILIPKIQADKRVPIRVFDEKFNVANTATLRPEWTAYVNEDSHYGLMRLNPSWEKYSAEEVQITRCGGGTGCHTVTDRGTYHWYYQNPVIVSEDYTYEFHFPKLPKSFALSLAFVKNNDKVMVKINNVPPGISVSSSQRVSSMAALRSARSTSYIVQGGHLWVQLIGTGLTNDRRSTHNQPFGIVYSAKTAVRVTISDGDDPKRYNPMADFNSGVDSRGGLASAHGATYRGISSGWGNTINWWDVVSSADGRNGFADYKFTPSANPQDWQHFQGLRVHTKLGGERKSPSKQFGYQVWVRDKDQGHTSLGMCESGLCTLDLKAKPNNKLDSVLYILIRVHIGFFSELDTAGAFQRVHLYNVTLV